MKTIIGENYYSGILDDLIINQDDDDVFEKLEVFLKKNKDKTKLLFISYDLKDKIEKLNSRNDDKINFPVIRCVVPEKIFSKKKFVNIFFGTTHRITGNLILSSFIELSFSILFLRS